MEYEGSPPSWSSTARILARSPLVAPTLMYNTTAPLTKTALLVLHACVEGKGVVGSWARLGVGAVEVEVLEVGVEVACALVVDVGDTAARAAGVGAVSAAAGAAGGVAAAARTREKGAVAAPAAGAVAELSFTPPRCVASPWAAPDAGMRRAGVPRCCATCSRGAAGADAYGDSDGKPAARGLPLCASRRRRARCAGAADGAGTKGEACGLSPLPAGEREVGCCCCVAAAAGGCSAIGTMVGVACCCCC